MTMKQPTEVEPKKAWIAPKLIVHGDLEKITKEVPVPKFGAGNGSM